MRLYKYIGLTGIAADENAKARFCSRMLEFPMIMAALWVMARWYLSTKGPGFEMHRGYDIGLWSLFVFETVLLTLLVNNPKSYLKGNWLNLIIIAMGLPLLWGAPSVAGALRILRVLILFSLLVHVGSSVRQLFEGKQLGSTLAGIAIIILMAGVMIATLDPGIETVTDGIWWAWVTVSTVGYGDLVPVSMIGRIFGAFLILLGLGLISLLTASIAAWFLSAQEGELASSEKETMKRVEQLEQRLKRIETKLDKALEQRVTKD